MSLGSARSALGLMSIWDRFGPPALARGLWGRGPMPLRYKFLFLGQSLIFSMAIVIRGRDVEKARQQKLAAPDKVDDDEHMKKNRT